MATRNADNHALIDALRRDPSRIDERVFGPGSTPLTALQYAIVMNDDSLFQEALTLGANIEVPDEFGSTPIMIATYNKRRTMAGSLAQRGVNLRATSGVGKTLLHHAVMHGDLALAKAALEAGVSVNAPDNEGYTPLHCAIVNNEFESVELLLARKADPTLRTNALAKAGADKSAFDFADGIGKDRIAELLATRSRRKWWQFWKA